MSPGALATESAHCATRTAKTSSARMPQLQQGAPDKRGAKSLPRRKTRKAPICTRCDDRETCVCTRCNAKSLPCRVAWKATICTKRKGWQAPAHASRDDRDKTTDGEYYTPANMQLIAIVLLLALITIDPRTAQDGAMSPKKIDWNANRIPKLPSNPTVTQIEAWSTEVAMSVEAATGSEFITRMMLGLTKNTGVQPSVIDLQSNAYIDIYFICIL